MSGLRSNEPQAHSARSSVRRDDGIAQTRAAKGGADPFQRRAPEERRDSVKRQADKPRRPRGRPVEHRAPDPIPDTPENVMRRLLGGPPRRRDEWDYVRRSGGGQNRDQP